ncbi:uncharacterized protein LOC122318644 [Carya illinoinensis]|uniref:uncharacterized protein LOC122318644 n=1 Tax=Carya illinoinensis TaxID=32201 RepID=UPI001C71A068|nr:uncharacterized protein LOC122318644 [Carya illinoinensis]
MDMDSLSSLKLKPCRGMISTFSLHCKSHLKQNPGREVFEENKEIKSHMSKLMSSLSVNEQGKFPSQAQFAPRGQHVAQENLKDVNAIVTQSGKSLHIPTMKKSEDVEDDQSNSGVELPKEAYLIKSSVKVPFPQVLKPNKRTLDPNNEILKNLKQVGISLPLLMLLLIVQMSL